MEYWISGGLFLLFISGIICLNKEVAKRPTYKEVEDKYTEIKLCKEVHKNEDEKLACLPEMKDTLTEIKTKIDMLLNNGNK